MAEMDTRIKALEKLVNNMEVKTESTEELIEDNEMSSTIGIGLGAAIPFNRATWVESKWVTDWSLIIIIAIAFILSSNIC